MKPYYSDELVTLYHGDCLEITEWLAADVLVTDPPYGVGGRLSLSSHGTYRPHDEFGRQEWDRDLDARDRALARWGDRPAAVFGSPRRLDAVPRYREVPLIWDKGDMVAAGDVAFPWRPTYELIFVSGEGWHGFRGPAALRSPHLSRTSAR